MGKKTKTIRAVIVDPFTRTIEDRDIETGLDTLNELVKGSITGIYPGNFTDRLKGVHAYVNDEGAFNRDWHLAPWMINPYEGLLGPAVFLGSDRFGNDVDCPVSALVISEHVHWLA